MNHLKTTAIVLSRTDYGEADRILTALTPDHGKLRLLAKGVRRLKSKLAGGVELFSVSQIMYIKGRGEIDTLVSARLETHYGKIVQDIDRTMLGYDLIKKLNKNTEDQLESDYFYLLQEALAALNDSTISIGLIRLWFPAQLLRLAGHTPNLQADTAGKKLQASQTYNFSFDDMTFTPAEANGRFDASAIKFLRLLFSSNKVDVLQNITQLPTLLETTAPLINTIVATQLRI